MHFNIFLFEDINYLVALSVFDLAAVWHFDKSDAESSQKIELGRKAMDGLDSFSPR